jgi:hypothetical protein
MPAKRRGDAWFRHPNYEAYMRPAPSNVQSHVLWLDLKELDDTTTSPVSPVTALAEAFELIGHDAVGYVTASARSIGIVFASADLKAKHVHGQLKSGLTLYEAIANPAPIVRLTLQGVPVQDKPAAITAIKTLIEPTGDLLEISPSWARVLSGSPTPSTSRSALRPRTCFRRQFPFLVRLSLCM